MAIKLIFKIPVITILFVLISITTFSQPPAPGSYTHFPDLDKFEGTWKWTGGNNEEVIIKLKKVFYYWNYGLKSYTEDVIMGSHSYTKNGVIIESNLSDFPNINAQHEGSIILWCIRSGNLPNYINGTIKDITKSNTDLLELTYVAGSTPTLIWHHEESGKLHITPPGTPRYDYTPTLPIDLILVKQP